MNTILRSALLASVAAASVVSVATAADAPPAPSRSTRTPVQSSTTRQSDRDRYAVLTEQNIIAQLRNLATHPSVAKRLADGRVTLHGWFYRIHSGEIAVYDRTNGMFRSLDPQPPVRAVPAHAGYRSQGDAA